MNKTIYRLISVIVSFTMVLGNYFSAGAISSNNSELALETNAYYVSITGSDTNAGTVASPFKTITKAINSAGIGWTIYVRSGTYPAFSIDKNSVTLSGYPGERPVISGGSGIRLIGQNLTFQNFDVTAMSNNWGAAIMSYGNNNTIRDNSVYGNIAPTVSGIIISASFNKVLNNIVHDNNVSGINIYGSSITATQNLIEGNTTYNHTMSTGNSDGMGCSGNSKENIFRNNITYDNSDDGLDVWNCTNNIVSNNTAYHNGGTGDGNGFKLGWGGGNIATGNTAYLNYACGFTSNGGGNYYENNVSYSNVVCGFDDGLRESGNTQTSSFINNVAYGNPLNFYKGAYTTVFTGNSESPINGTATNIPVNTPTRLPSTPTVTASPMPILPTVTLTSAPTATPIASLPPTLIPATQITVPSGTNSVDVRVPSGESDVEENSRGRIYMNSTNLEMVYDTSTQKVGIRFPGVNIPQGATIVNAYIQFNVGKVSTGDSALYIQAENSANASAFTNTNRNVSSRPRTIGSVKWNPSSWRTVGSVQSTPNLSPIIQEIVSQSGWSAGNSMVIIITGQGKRVAKAYESNAVGAPILHIEYTINTAANISVLSAEKGISTELPTVLPATVTQVSSPTVTFESPSPTPTSPVSVLPTLTPTSITVKTINEYPMITSNDNFSVAENTTAVSIVTATDADTLTYSIAGGTDAALFYINSTTGELTFITAPNYKAPTDADLDNIYNVTIQVSDGSLIVTQNVFVTVKAVE